MSDDLDFEFNLTGDDEGAAGEGKVSEIKDKVEQGDWEGAAAIFELAPAGTADVLLEDLRQTKEQKPETIETVAKMFAEARDFDHAAQAFSDVGDLGQAALHAAKQGRFFEAAQLYQRLGDVHQEVAMLQQVPPTSKERVPAVDRLAELMVEHGYLADAAVLLTDTMRALEDKQRGIVLAVKLVPLLTRLDKRDEAVAVQQWLDQNAPAIEPLVGEPVPPRPPSTPPTMALPITSAAAPPKDKDGAAYRSLKGIPMFAELSLVDMKDLYKICELKTEGPGSLLLQRGKPVPGLMAIVDGDVQVSVGARKIAVVSRGGYLGEMGLVRDAPASADATALGVVVTLFMERSRFEQYLSTRPEAAAKIWRLFCQNLADRLAQVQ